MGAHCKLMMDSEFPYRRLNIRNKFIQWAINLRMLGANRQLLWKRLGYLPKIGLWFIVTHSRSEDDNKTNNQAH